MQLMSEAVKEMIVEAKKRQIRSLNRKEVADELCRQLDEAKKEADKLEQLYNNICNP